MYFIYTPPQCPQPHLLDWRSLTVYDGVMDCGLGHSCLVCSAIFSYM